ncbi:MAG: hypothetical protein OXL41_07870 [Nitrospinae bacterium]|nr:hypothetical protein [Nitrospinota bacterium]
MEKHIPFLDEAAGPEPGRAISYFPGYFRRDGKLRFGPDRSESLDPEGFVLFFQEHGSDESTRLWGNHNLGFWPIPYQ